MEADHDPDKPAGNLTTLLFLLLFIGILIALVVCFANWARSVDEDLRMLKETMPTTKK
jgi:hypothetical protein